MDFHIQRDELIRALTRASGIVEKRSSTPILSCVLLQAGPQGVRLVATDKSLVFVGDFQASVSSPGEVAVDCANFLSIARVLPNDTVHVKLGEGFRVEVRCGMSFFKLSALGASEFPMMPPLDAARSVQIGAADFRKAISQTVFAVASEDNRYGLNGAHVEDVAGEASVVRFVATDGNRLSWSQVPYSGELVIGRKMLLPRKALAEMARLLEGVDADSQVELGFADRGALFKVPGSQLCIRLLEADFPNYREVLPSSWKRRVVVDRNRFADALRRVAVFAADSTHSVRFSFSEDGIRMAARKPDAGDSTEELPAELTGEPISMGFNARFVQDVLAVVPDGMLSVELGDTLSPCIIRSQQDPNATFVVMPVRLD
jgi:DNA polymerase-3 subunit beta